MLDDEFVVGRRLRCAENRQKRRMQSRGFDVFTTGGGGD